MLIEKDTNYSFWVNKNAGCLTYKNLIDKARYFTQDFDGNANQELRDMLMRGIEIITTEFQMQKYMDLFAEMHENKLLYAFSFLSDELINQKEIEIIDYACGQGIGSIIYAEYLKTQKISQRVRKITLIEPSEKSIERAALHVQAFYPNTEIITINKFLGDLDEYDIVNIGENSLHIFSNILDIETIDLLQLSDFVKLKMGNNSHIVCVSPRNECFTKRINTFTSLLEGNCYFSKDVWKKDWNLNCAMSLRLVLKNNCELLKTSELHISINDNIFQELMSNMVMVNGGTFDMGATLEQEKDYWENELPVHQVDIDRFKICKYPVSQKLWYAIMGENPSFFKNAEAPVESITWFECQKFIELLSKIMGIKFSLPTEAQWEYASRGGNSSKFYKFSGCGEINDVTWYSENSGFGTKPIGQKKANELGLYDMSGNIWEWCQDWFASYSALPQVNPICEVKTNNKVIRGGSWSSGKDYCRITSRQFMNPLMKQNFLGFRLIQII